MDEQYKKTKKSEPKEILEEIMKLLPSVLNTLKSMEERIKKLEYSLIIKGKLR